MKKLLLIAFLGTVLTACGNNDDNSTEETLEVSEATTDESAEAEEQKAEEERKAEEELKAEEERKAEEIRQAFYLHSMDANFINNVSSNPGIMSIDVVNETMTQAEVEELYGASYDTILPQEGSNFAVYGNVAVQYSERTPFGQDSSYASSDINPETNYVEAVYPVMNLSYESMINTFGQPLLDYDEFDIRGPGAPAMFYKTAGNEIVGVDIHETESQGLVAGLIHINGSFAHVKIPLLVKEFMYALDGYYTHGDTYYQTMLTEVKTAEDRINHYKSYHPGMQTVDVGKINFRVSQADDELIITDQNRTITDYNTSEVITISESYYINTENGEYKIDNIAFEVHE